MTPDSTEVPDHKEVMATSEMRAKDMQTLVQEFVSRM